MQAAINAGKTFVEIALKGKNKERNRIALVSYSSITDVLLDSPFSNNADTLKGIIDQYKINGSTATGTALLKAVQQMANSQAKNKIIVLLSDGEPYPPDTPPHWEEINQAKANGVIFYSVALDNDISPHGQAYLKQVATDASKYITADPQTVETEFSKIAGGLGSPMKDIVVTDKIGDGFEPTDASKQAFAASGGRITYDAASNTITWKPDGLKPDDQDELLYKAELKYQVQATDKILDIAPQEGGKYWTNKEATVKYKDKDGGDHNGTFPKPAVDVLLVKLVKEFAGGANSGRTFKVNITPNNGSAKEYTLTPGKAQLVTNLTVGGTYTIEETGVTGGGTVADYAVKINGQDGAKLEGYTVPQGNKWGMSDTEIKVINAEKGDGKLTVKKAFTAGQAGAPNAPQGVVAPKFKFKFTKAPEGSGLLNTAFELAVGEEKPFANLPYGTYAVTEDGNADFTVTGDKEVTLSINEKEKTITLTNTPKKGETDFTAVKKWVGGKAEDHKKVTLTLLADGQEVTQAPAPTVTPDAEPADEYTYKWTRLPNYYNNGAKIKYSVEERNVPEGYAATYNADHTEVTNTNQKEGEINVNKTWTGPEPNVSEIKIRLLKDAQPVPGGEITLKKAEGWKGKFEFLDKDLSKYTVEEQEPVTNNWVGNGGKIKIGDVEYNVKINGTGTPNINITNAGPDGGLTVSKRWPGATPNVNSVEVQLFKGDQPVQGKKLTLKQSESWIGKFEYLEGDLGQYTVKEIDPANPGSFIGDGEEITLNGVKYKVSVDTSQAGQGKITIVNTGNAGKDLTVTKKWIGQPVADVKIQLYKNGAPEGNPETLNAGNNWTHKFTGLEEDLGQYTVKEEDPANPGTFVGNGGDITITISPGKNVKYKVSIITDQGQITVKNAPAGNASLTVIKRWIGDKQETKIAIFKAADLNNPNPVWVAKETYGVNQSSHTFTGLEEPLSQYVVMEWDEEAGGPGVGGYVPASDNPLKIGTELYILQAITNNQANGRVILINKQQVPGAGNVAVPKNPHPHWYPDF